MQGLKQLFILSLLTSGSILYQNNANACHALPLTSFTIDTTSDPNGIIVYGSSDPLTFGCSGYWMDIEVRCENETFDGAQFNPGLYIPLNSHPYYQSPSQLIKNSGTDPQNYPPTFIPYSALCPGITYKIRARENHNGDVSPWTGALTFTAPGAVIPGVVVITATPSTVCPGNPVELEAFITGGCGLAQNIEWFSAPDLNGAPQLPWVSTGLTTNPATVFPTENTWYTIVVEDICNDTSYTDMVLVSMLPLPVPGLLQISDELICEGQEIFLNVSNYFGDIHWEESQDGGNTWNMIPGLLAPLHSDIPTAPVTCYRVGSTACNTTVFSNIVCADFGGFPGAQFSFTNSCAGQDVVFTPDVAATSVNVSSYAWNFGDGNTSAQAIPTHSFENYGNYTVELIVITDLGCADTLELSIDIYPNPVIDFSGTSVCLNDPSVFTNTSNVDVFDNDVITDYTWDFGDGNTSTQNEPTHTYTNSDEYTVSLTATTNNGCSSTGEITVTVWDLPVPDMDFADNCVDYEVLFQDVTQPVSGNPGDQITDWEWQFGDGNSSSEQNPAHFYTSSGNLVVTLTVTNSNGCSNSVSENITIVPAPVADFSHNPLGGMIPVEITFTNNSSGGNTYDWDFANGQTSSSTTADNAVITYTIPGVYLVSHTVDNGYCIAMDTATIVIEDYPDPEFILPNIFSPNGDGSNDFMTLSPTNTSRFEVVIYNRWNNIVGRINSDENPDGWDGNDHKSGSPVSEGVYFYTYEIEALNGTILTGHQFVHLVR